MPTDVVIRFVLGGIIVSAFAVLGELLRPKSFAGVFGAAPSVALATLGMAFASHGAEYVGIEARSMLAGGVALAVYGWLVSRRLLVGGQRKTLPVAGAGLSIWALTAVGLWATLLR